MKKWAILFLVIALIEGGLLIKYIRLDIERDKMAESVLVSSFLQVKRNVNDTLRAKGEMDLIYTCEEAAVFLEYIHDYCIANKIGCGSLDELVRDYIRLIRKMSRCGYNEEYERYLNDFNKCFELMEIDYDTKDAEFPSILKKFNENIWNESSYWDIHNNMNTFLGETAC